MAVGSERGKRRNEVVATLPVHERDLKLATVLSQDFGPASTTGVYTHPASSSEADHFPSGDQSAPSYHENHDAGGLDARVGRRSEDPSTHPAATKVLPIREAGHAAQLREGTSSTRYTQQQHTHAEGQMAAGTPAPLHHGYGDKTHTVEPSTVGQGRKDVGVPRAQGAAEDESTYLGQAKAVASSAYDTAASAATSVLGSVGLAGKQEQAEAEPAAPQVRPSREDPRISHMEDRKVEDFIRNKYASHPDYGKGK